MERTGSTTLSRRVSLIRDVALRCEACAEAQKDLREISTRTGRWGGARSQHPVRGSLPLTSPASLLPSGQLAPALRTRQNPELPAKATCSRAATGGRRAALARVLAAPRLLLDLGAANIAALLQREDLTIRPWPALPLHKRTGRQSHPPVGALSQRSI